MTDLVASQDSVEPALIEQSMDRLTWRVTPFRTPLGEEVSQANGLLVLLAVVGSMFCPPLGLLFGLAFGAPGIEWALSAMRGPAEVTVGLHRLTVERASPFGRTSVLDVPWSEVRDIAAEGRTLVVTLHNGQRRIAHDVGQETEVRWLAESLPSHAPATGEPDPDRAEQEREAYRAVEQLMGRRPEG